MASTLNIEDFRKQFAVGKICTILFRPKEHQLICFLITGDGVWAFWDDKRWYKCKIVGKDTKQYVFPGDNKTPVTAYKVHYHNYGGE